MHAIPVKCYSRYGEHAREKRGTSSSAAVVIGTIFASHGACLVPQAVGDVVRPSGGRCRLSNVLPSAWQGPGKSVSRIGIGKVRFEVIMASGDLIILFAGLNSNDGPFMSTRVICCLVAQISITKLLRRFTSPFCAFHVHGEVLLDMMLTGHMLFPYLFSL